MCLIVLCCWLFSFIEMLLVCEICSIVLGSGLILMSSCLLLICFRGMFCVIVDSVVFKVCRFICVLGMGYRMFVS